jgi:hypothetical protein
VLRAAYRILGPTHQAILAFEAAAPDLKNLRDMIEHFDAYLVGEGNLQETTSGLRARSW